MINDAIPNLKYVFHSFTSDSIDVEVTLPSVFILASAIRWAIDSPYVRHYIISTGLLRSSKPSITIFSKPSRYLFRKAELSSKNWIHLVYQGQKYTELLRMGIKPIVLPQFSNNVASSFAANTLCFSLKRWNFNNSLNSRTTPDFCFLHGRAAFSVITLKH